MPLKANANKHCVARMNEIGEATQASNVNLAFAALYV